MHAFKGSPGRRSEQHTVSAAQAWTPMCRMLVTEIASAVRVPQSSPMPPSVRIPAGAFGGVLPATSYKKTQYRQMCRCSAHEKARQGEKEITKREEGVKSRDRTRVVLG